VAEGTDLILAVESATRAVSVALLRGETLLAEETSDDERQPSERLLPAIDALLRGAGGDVFELMGRALVREHFPVEKMVEDLHALYLRLLGLTSLTRA